VAEEAEHGFFLDEGFDDADAAIGFLGVGGEVAEEGLDMLAFFVDDGVDHVYRDGQDGQGGEDVEAEEGVLAEHEEEAETDRYEEVGEVHDGWTREHADAADVFRHAAHEVAGGVGLVEVHVQLLVVGVDLVLLVEFDVAAHDDDGLAHEEEETAADQGKDQQGDAAEDDLSAEGGVAGVHCSYEFPYQDVIVGGVAGGSAGVFCGFPGKVVCLGSGLRRGIGAGGRISRPAAVSSQFAFDGVDDIAGHLRSQDAEIVGQDDKDEAQEKAPAIFPEILVYCL